MFDEIVHVFANDFTDRGDIRITRADIEYELKNNPANRIYLHPSLFDSRRGTMKKDDLPEGLEIIENPGTMSWEFWLPAAVQLEKQDGKVFSEVVIQPHDSENVLSKLPKLDDVPPAVLSPPVIDNAWPQKHSGGRPRKIGEVSERTLYRRKAEQKEKSEQGKLI